MTTAIPTGKRAAYPAYKPSGVPWLGNVPEHWEVRRLKYAADLINTKVDGADNDLPYTGLEHIESWTGRRITPNGDGTSEGQANLYRRGDVLFGKLRPYLAKAHAADSDGICTGELLVLRPKVVRQKFLVDYVLNPDFVAIVDSSTYGAKMPRANWDFIGNLPALIPPDDEQRAIAAFLDRETARIDALVEKKRRQIELLYEKRSALISHAVTKGLDPNAPMKDSGIEWLGQIPKHWDTPPLYARFTVELGKMLDAKRIKGEFLLPYLRNIDVQWDRVNVENLPEMDIAPGEYSRFTLTEGDLLICEGGEVGRTAIWRGELPVCAFQKAIHRVRPRSKRDLPRFFYYVMRVAASSGVFLAYGNPNTIPHLTAEKLRVYRFAFPPRDEQEKIVSHLDHETRRIDALVTKVQTSIETLQEFRTALISTAVTGKIDVREEVTL